MKKIVLYGTSGLGKYAIIDDADFDLISQYKWRIIRGYARSAKSKDGIRKTFSMHRLIMNPSKGEQIDHINRNKLDNRRSNLRICTNGENQSNGNAYKNNKSGFKGVSRRVRNGREVIEVRITKDKKTYYLGSFQSMPEAVMTYNDYAKRLHGEFARLNSWSSSPKDTAQIR